MTTIGMRWVVRDDGVRVYGIPQPRASINGVPATDPSQDRVLVRRDRLGSHTVPGWAVKPVILPWVVLVRGAE